MKNRNLLALAILSGMLTACGGSDDDSNNPADPKNNPPPLQGPSPGLQYQHRVDPLDTDGSHGIIDSNGNGNNNGGNNNSGNNNGGTNPPGTNPPGTNPPGTNPPGTNPPGTNPPNPKSYNQIAIKDSNNNYKTIDLLPSNVQPGSNQGTNKTYKSDDSSYKKLNGNDLKYALYGVIIDKTDGNTAHAFYRDSQDESTRGVVLPQKEVFYQGHVIHYDVANRTLVEGTALFDVNFPNRKIEGGITAGSARIPISATISGERFSGSSSNNVTVEGRFYGPEGHDMSGIYGKGTGDRKEFIGSFGAVPQ